MNSVVSFYKFVNIPDIDSVFCHIKSITSSVKGTILIAEEGINGTIAGGMQDTNLFCEELAKLEVFSDIEFKKQMSDVVPFGKMKVKVKDEIIKFCEPADPRSNSGERLSWEAWESLISRDDVILIDTRNSYEYIFGTFKGAINPKTKNFTDLPKWLDEELSEDEKHKPIAMFCTGGVRCEKSTAYLKERGFEQVYHLDGGILKYLEGSKNGNNLWRGKCFVFDDRVLVDDKLRPAV